VKRLALLALLLASSSLVAAAAPMPKPQRKAEPVPKEQAADQLHPSADLGGVPVPPPAVPVAPIPARAPNAEPPG
jgi:hypothetical protein